jgi:hypothetical protein
VDEPVPTTKPTPFTVRVKLDATPAITEDGSICSIVGPLVMDTLAVADFVGSARLVAVTETAFGDGATLGAV